MYYSLINSMKSLPTEISSHIRIRFLYTRGLSWTVWPQYTTRQTDRQTDRAMAIGRLCYSIGGLKIIYELQITIECLIASQIISDFTPRQQHQQVATTLLVGQAPSRNIVDFSQVKWRQLYLSWRWRVFNAPVKRCRNDAAQIYYSLLLNALILFLLVDSE